MRKLVWKEPPKELSEKHARSILNNGRWAKRGARCPYRVGTSQWVIWKTGNINRKEASADQMIEVLRLAGVPILSKSPSS